MLRATVVMPDGTMIKPQEGTPQGGPLSPLLSEPHAVEWLLIEWPEGEDEPTKFCLSTLPEEMTLQGLVEAAKI